MITFDERQLLLYLTPLLILTFYDKVTTKAICFDLCWRFCLFGVFNSFRTSRKSSAIIHKDLYAKHLISELLLTVFSKWLKLFLGRFAATRRFANSSWIADMVVACLIIPWFREIQWA